MNKINKISYWAVIPAGVRYDIALSQGAKLLYAEITALCNKEGYCWATNAYFGNLYCVSNRTIQNWLKDLQAGNYIIFKEGKGKKRKIYIIADELIKRDNENPNREKNFIDTVKKISQIPRKKFHSNREKNFAKEGVTLYKNNKRNSTREYNENSLSISSTCKQDEKEDEVIKRRTIKFEEIFKKYPRQTYHDKSLKMFLTTITNNEEYNKLKKAIKNYSESDEVWKGRVMNFTNFLPDYDYWAKQEN